jgi:hypothetical protein
MRRGIKIRLFVFGCLLALFLIAGGTVWWLVHHYLIKTQPLSDTQIAELEIDYTQMTKGRWSPWQIDAEGNRVWNPVAGYNGWVRTLKDDERAWPELFAWWSAHPEMMDHPDKEVLPYESVDYQFIRDWHADPEHASSLDAMLSVIERPYLGAQFTDLMYGEQTQADDPTPIDLRSENANISLFDAGNPALGTYRRLTLVIHQRAGLAIEQGDADPFVELIGRTQRSISLLDEFPVAIDQLVQLAVLRHGYSYVLWALEEYPHHFRDSHLAQLDASIEATKLDGYNHLAELMFLEDILRRFATKGGKFRFAAIANSFANDIDLFDVLGPPTHKTVDEFDTTLQQPLYLMYKGTQYGDRMSRIPWNGEDVVLPYATTYGFEPNPVTSKFAWVFFAAYDRVAMTFLQHQQTRIGLRTAIALHRHKLRHRRFPESVSEIDADLLAFEPVDLFTNEPLMMTMRDGQVRVYSTGPDRIDDNGEPIWREMFGAEARTYERKMRWISAESAQNLLDYSPHEISGDFVLFPTPRDDPYEDEP